MPGGPEPYGYALGIRTGRTFSLFGLEYAAWRQQDFAAARARNVERVRTERDLGNRPGVAHAALWQGAIALAQGDFAAAHASYSESLAILREASSPKDTNLPMVLAGLGKVAMAHGEYGHAEAHIHEGLRLAGAIGNRFSPQHSHSLTAAQVMMLGPRGRR